MEMLEDRRIVFLLALFNSPDECLECMMPYRHVRLTLSIGFQLVLLWLTQIGKRSAGYGGR
jgi:hypothetical protein